MCILTDKVRSIKNLLLAMLVLSLVGCAHPEVDEHNPLEKQVNDSLAFHCFFIDEDKILSTSKYILEYDYETGFEPVCDDLFCDHAGKNCPAYFAESEKENYMRSYSFGYQKNLFLLNTYEGETIGVDDDLPEFTRTFYTELVKADENGENREKVAELPLYLRQSPSSTTMMICGNTLWITGWKEECTVITRDEATKETQFDSQTLNVLYQINLDTFEYKEVMTWKTRDASIMELVASEQDVYVNSCYVLEDGTTNEGIIMHYSIENQESEQLPLEGRNRLIGIYAQYMFYQEDGLWRYDSTTREYTCMSENFVASFQLFSDGIAGKVKDEGFELISFDGKTKEKIETGNISNLVAEIGDKVFYVIGTKLYWVYREELADSDEKGVLIGSMMGAKYESEGDLIWK